MSINQSEVNVMEAVVGAHTRGHSCGWLREGVMVISVAEAGAGYSPSLAPQLGANVRSWVTAEEILQSHMMIKQDFPLCTSDLSVTASLSSVALLDRATSI